MNSDNDVITTNCRLAKELLDERDDVYIIFCVNGLRENDSRIKQSWGGMLQGYNLISDQNSASIKAKAYL